ncbi:hypothetical protein UFOVP231_61 [uncultured Caudovirales phage]|uniref:Uncharacterized protein n=1 Tax=uncultured Caudovirales phage TaxID=2100421 RepID=A0A6J7WQD4_9CAUD|nr:hypothetical protein UFOVP231_61 [uncultured Caudovirales phage]
MSDLIKQLRERIEELEEQNRQLRDGVAPDETMFIAGLSRQQIALLRGIYSRKTATYQYLDVIMANDGHSARGCGSELEKLRSKVAIYNLRKKLAPHGIKISTWRGIGYYLNEANREKLKRLMEKKDDEA